MNFDVVFPEEIEEIFLITNVTTAIQSFLISSATAPSEI